MNSNRRDFLRGALAATAAGATLTFPPSIQRALAIPARRRTGTLRDVEHVVILMQENRSFDHYFGTLHGVRGFGDRFPIPVRDRAGLIKKTVWLQPSEEAPATPVVAPFRVDTTQDFKFMRLEGTPHGWVDGQLAWADGKLDQWPLFKNDHAMGYFARQDLPFQFAMAEAFTICDAYHCSIMSSTNPNRLYLWTGTNDGLGRGGGPALDNRYDNPDFDPQGGYTWVTYTERLQKAGISWQVYQNLPDNFTDNSLAGFRTYRDAIQGLPGALMALKERGWSSVDLDRLLEDVQNDRLPQVSFIVATAEGSEHPGPSSPAQGADYTARVLDALTSNPEVWSKTVLFVNFDENDGYFDHVPPPAPPTYVDFAKGELAGASTANTAGEYHEILEPGDDEVRRSLQHKPYGLGPRVPMYVLSPWSKGGWVNSEVFDHTSVIQFLEKRFGVREPNISDWRRAVTGDLTSAFDFRDPDNRPFFEEFPDTTELAEQARALPGRSTPPTPQSPDLPAQDIGTRLSRALPYELHVHGRVAERAGRIDLRFESDGAAGACFHVYDRLHLERAPRRYTVESRKRLTGAWHLAENEGAYDLWVLGPNGFHRRFAGKLSAERTAEPEIRVEYDSRRGDVKVDLVNDGADEVVFFLSSNTYFYPGRTRIAVPPRRSREHRWSLGRTAHWYDFTVTVQGDESFVRRFAGRVETGRDSYSDPAMGGVAIGDQD